MKTLLSILRIITAFCAFRLLITAMPCYAQAWDGREIIPVAPDAWNFLKYGGNTAPDLYTGTLHFSIPLYSYTDPDFEIPLSLDYTTSGFMPNATTGTTGMGWTLNAGGYISREVRQVPDGSDSNLSGSQEYALDSLTGNPFGRNPHNFDQETGTFYYYIPGGGGMDAKKVETEPDVFSFKFNGHSGKFILARILEEKSQSIQAFVYGTAQPAGEYRVDAELFGMGEFRFTIVTGDGFKYHFDRMAGQDDCWITKRSWGSGDDVPSSSGTSVTWSLVSIEAPNGRKVRFTYRLFSSAACVKPSVSQGTCHFQKSDDSPFLPELETELNTFRVASHNIYQNNYAVLDSIVVEDAGLVIKNRYSTRLQTEGYMRSNASSSKELLWPMQKLDSIEIRDVIRNRPLRKILFSYKHPQNLNSNPVLILKNVYISGEGDYSMDYNNEDGEFPYQGTTSVDHWGYYNGGGRYDVDDFLPQISLDDNLVQTVTNDVREPNFSGSIMGTLRKVRYPAGGWTRFEYEQHDYSVCLTRDLSSNNLPYLKPTGTSLPAGGVRIRKIVDYPSVSDSTCRVYTYENKGLSSGLILRYPQYFQIVMNEAYSGGKRTFIIYAVRASYGFYAHTQDRSYICYPDVVETMGNGAVTKYHFSSYLDAECRDLFPNEETERRAVEADTYYNSCVHAAYLEPDSRHALRGKLLRKESYVKDQFSPWSVERYKYRVQGPTPPYCTSVKNAISKLYVSKNYLDNCLADEWSCTYFEGQDSLMIHKKYSYNRLNQQTGVCTTDYGLKTSRISERLYLDDIVSDSDSVHRYMKELNVIRFPVKTLTAFFGATDPSRIGYELTDGTYYEFQRNGNMICVSSVKKAKIPPAGNGLGTFCGFDFDHLLITAASYRYNHKNYPVEIRNRADRPTCIVWGYNGLYPVAKIENCSLYEFEKILLSSHQGYVFNAELPSSLQYVIYQRNDMEMTAYDYIPNVGVTCIRDPAERCTYYEYDHDGKLSCIADDKLRLVKAFKYHIKNQ